MVDFFEFQLRTRVLYKPGLVREMSNEVEAMGARRAFIVTDKGVEQAGLLDRVRDSLQLSLIHI